MPITPNDQVISTSTEDIEIDNNFKEGECFLKINNIKNKQGVYRLFAKLISPQDFNPSSIKLLVAIYDQLYPVEVPKSFSENDNHTYWDIGFIISPTIRFVEINSPTVKEINRLYLLKEYQELLKFL